MAAAVATEPIEGRQGHYAGAVSRLLAFAVDAGASWGLFTLGAAALAFSVQLVTGRSFSLSSHQIASLVSGVIWEFIYFAYQWSSAGKTIGMALLGIRVVKTDGTPIGPRQAILRTLTLPLSFLFLGLGFIGVRRVVRRRRRQCRSDHPLRRNEMGNALVEHLARHSVVSRWDLGHLAVGRVGRWRQRGSRWDTPLQRDRLVDRPEWHNTDALQRLGDFRI